MTDILNDIKVTDDRVISEKQISDKNLLRKERYKFGVANVLFQGEEAGLTPIHTVIVRALGGSTIHLGVAGAIGGIGSLVQWMAVFLLKRYKSNKKAMFAALGCGAACALLTCGIILLALNPAFRIFSLWAYLVLALALAGLSGMQWNVETSWIGGLVDKKILGWFSGAKYIVGIFGILFFTMFFGKLADLKPSFITYAGFFIVICLSHILAIWCMSTIPDRIPKNANFISGGQAHHERLNYKSLPLWCYTIFYMVWAGGRTAMLAFMTAYLIDQFDYSVTSIALIFAIQSVVGMVLIILMGRASDKFGNRVPLILVSGTVSCCMFLWVTSAWWGIIPIIVYQVINGAAGFVHNMLSINYGLEIFPEKGRAGYFGFSRLLVGLTSITTPVIAGAVLKNLFGFQFILYGAEINHYHVFFAFCSIITLSSIIPLLIAGKRVVVT